MFRGQESSLSWMIDPSFVDHEEGHCLPSSVKALETYCREIVAEGPPKDEALLTTLFP